MERKGVEPSTSALRTQRGVVATENQQELTTTLDSCCTNGCTDSTPTGSNADPLEKLTAALLLTLSPADRERLAAALTRTT